MWIRRTENKGYSLVEVVVTIAIMAVVVGGVVGLSGMIPRAQVNGCAEEMILQVEKTRTEAMSYRDAWIEIYKGTDGIYVDRVVDRNGNGTVDTGEMDTIYIGDPGIVIEYKAGSSYTTLTEHLKLRFVRSTGGFKKPFVGSVESTEDCTGLKLSKGSFVREVELVPLTGKITYKN